jgi:aminoglycoside phosphotransferase (APT) family kinase protein
MVTLHLDSLIARGNTSDVYRWGEDSVVKVLRPDIPFEWARREAETTALVHAAGLPAPAVRDEITIGGRPGIVFEGVDGVSMWARMLASPEEIAPLSRLLAELQAEVNATPAPAGLPRLKDRLRRKIERAQLLSPEERAAARTRLESLEAGDALCHFDVHPNNVLMGSSRPVIIDWYDAAAGSPAADLVRTSALMRHDAADTHLPCGDRTVITRAHDSYVAAVAHLREIEEDDLSRWESPVLAARLAEPISEGGLLATLGMWRAACAGQPTDLVQRVRSARRQRPG